MEKQLRRTMFHPGIAELVGEISSLVRMIESPEELRTTLEEHIDDVDRIRQDIINDQTAGDGVLRTVGDTLASKLFQGRTRREYVMITKCDTCATDKRRQRAATSKTKVPVPAADYLYEHEFNSALQEGRVPKGLNPERFSLGCPNCGSTVNVTSTSNMIFPETDQPVFAIAQRVKSAGRYCEKLVDTICYDLLDTDLRTARSITDKYAFAIIMNHPNGMRDEERRRMFRRQFGLTVGDGNFGDALCYAMRDFLTASFGGAVGRVQDSIRDPKRRVSPRGMVEEYKMLQFNFGLQGRTQDDFVVEGQIKTSQTYQREQDRKSAISHEAYVEVENQLRQEMFMRVPRARVAYEILMRLFASERQV